MFTLQSSKICGSDSHCVDHRKSFSFYNHLLCGFKKNHHPHPATYNNSNDSNSHKVSQQLQMLFLMI